MKLFVIVSLLSGVIISFLLAGVKRKLWLKLINIPLSVALSAGLFALVLHLISPYLSIEQLNASVFSNISLTLILLYIYIMTCVASGLLLGIAESYGISRYMRALYHSGFFKPLVAGFLLVNIAFASLSSLFPFETLIRYMLAH